MIKERKEESWKEEIRFGERERRLEDRRAFGKAREMIRERMWKDA